MTLPLEKQLAKIQFYVTTPYSCGYLPKQLAQSLIATPHHLIDADIYNNLIHAGFRRSGKFAYRPHCEDCKACIPVRLLIDDFKPNRSQKRAFKQHESLTVAILPLQYAEEHYHLYLKYQVARHNGNLLDDNTDQYKNFLTQSNVNTFLLEFREETTLKMVSVVDVVEDGVSAVYTFYEPADGKASYGTYNVLWQQQWCKALGLPYLYLGYWIEKSHKMAYKKNFQPLEALQESEWHLLSL